MKQPTPRYPCHRFAYEIIRYAAGLSHRFCLSFREIDGLLAERRIVVTYESLRQWCQKFGPHYAG